MAGKCLCFPGSVALCCGEVTRGKAGRLNILLHEDQSQPAERFDSLLDTGRVR